MWSPQARLASAQARLGRPATGSVGYGGGVTDPYTGRADQIRRPQRRPGAGVGRFTGPAARPATGGSFAVSAHGTGISNVPRNMGVLR